MKFRVTKPDDLAVLPWVIENPEGRVVYRAGSQEGAFALARMFARRRELFRLIREDSRD